MKAISEEQADRYVGHWKHPDFVFRPLVIGDLVILDDNGRTILAEIVRIDEDGIWFEDNNIEYTLNPEKIIAIREDW